MSELLKQILNKINNEDNIYKICNDLNISIQQLNYYLSILKNNYFYDITRSSTRTGNIIFRNDPREAELFKNNKLTRIFGVPGNQDKDYFRSMFISDIHAGSESECTKEVLYQTYNYCGNNNIHVIFCNGDWIDGINKKGAQFCSDLKKQSERLIHYFPYDHNISVVGVEGDHEHSDTNYSFDFAAYIERYRSDIILFRDNYGRIAIGKDFFEMYHKRPNAKEFNDLLNFTGHTHMFQIRRFINRRNNSGILNVGVPSLSSIINPIPSCLDVIFELNNGLIQNIYIKQLVSINGELKPFNELVEAVRKK